MAGGVNCGLFIGISLHESYNSCYMKTTLLILLVLSFSQLSLAYSQDLTQAEILKLLGRYPSHGSIEEKNDFEQMLELQRTRTKLDCEVAEAEAKPDIKRVFTHDHGPLTISEMNEAYAKILPVYEAAQQSSRYAKSLYRRNRPYMNNPEIKPCISMENSFSYPSGHTTISRAVARALSILFPERKELLIQRADEVAFHRVLGGVHHPSDIAAGKKLGDEVAKRSESLIEL